MNTSAWIEALGWTLIHSVWQAAIIAACLWMACLAARRARPQFRYIAACLALLAAITVTGATFFRELKSPRFSESKTTLAQIAAAAPQIAIPAAGDRPSFSAERFSLPLPPRPEDFEAGSPVARSAIPRANLRDRVAQALHSFTSTIVVAWLLGVSLSSVRLWRSWRAVCGLRESGQLCELPALEKRFIALRSSLRASQAARFLVSARVRVPMVIGWLKPVILLPASVLAGLSIAQLEAVLAHELAHIRRHDYLVNLLQNAVETVFFYHPAVWWISRLIREEREHCCDDIAAAATGGAVDYVHALAALEETRATAPDLVIAINGGSLLGRARRLLLQKPAEGPAHGLVAGGLVLLLVAGLFVIPFTLSQAADPAQPGQTNANTQGIGKTPSANELFRTFDDVERRGLWPAELLQQLPFGPAHSTGLRAAWIFRPMQNAYAIGDSLACRIVIHNAGKEPVEFFADSWIQDGQWSVLNANGVEVTPKKTKFARRDQTEQSHRLAPGETVELTTPGLGIGGGDFDEVYGDDRIGVYLPARAGEEYRCKWTLTFRGAWPQGDPGASATPVRVSLATGEVKFRVYARDPAAPKPVSIATSPGRYILEPALDLRILRMNFQTEVTVNGSPRPPLPAREQNWASIDPRPAVIPPGGKITRKVSGFRLPDGDGTYVIAWQRGERALWIGEADGVRKVDLTVAGKFPLQEVLDAADPLEREKMRELSEQFSSGVSFPEKQWKWEDAAGFEGMPLEIKTVLEQHRPKLVKPEPGDPGSKPPVDGAKIYADAEKLASSFRPAEGAAPTPANASGLSLQIPSDPVLVDASAPAPAPAAKPSLSREALEMQRAKVEKIRNEKAAVDVLKPDDFQEVFRVLGIEDQATRKAYDSLQSALSEEAKHLASGLSDSHPRVKAARAAIEMYRKLLADQLESIKRAQRTKLQIEEAQLKTMERFSPPAKEPEARHEQTRDLLKLWRAEFERKPLFAIAINEKMQRKETPSQRAVSPGSADRSRDVTFLDGSLSSESEPQAPQTLPETVPAEAMQRVAKQVRKYIETSPGPAAEKFESLLPRLEADRIWPWAEASAMLDELCDIATGPVGWLELEEQLRAFNRAKKGQAWNEEALEAVPFGPPNEQGLRAAWIFDPMQATYAVGDVLKSRVLFHNAGTQPIEFGTDAWHQEDRWNVTDATGKPVKVKTTWFTGMTPLQRLRLDPGQVAEVAGHGVGIGGSDYSEKYSVGAIGAEIPAQPGDELRCAWDVKVKLAGDTNAALRTGEVKFSVVAADPNATKPPGIATAPGRYDLAPGIKLQVSQVTSGKDGEPTTRANTATILWLDAAHQNTLKWPIELPPGLNTYVIAWPRGGTAFWIGQAAAVRKIDFSNAANVREENWKWEDGGGFGDIPAVVKAALEKHRPKSIAAAAPISAPAASAEVPKQSWKAMGRVMDKEGKPMPDVEIWVHTGSGSLMRTGTAKTDAEGRYEVEFGVAVMMEKESAQLQFANITAHKPGFYETRLNRHGAGAAATREVPAEDLKSYSVTAAALALPGKPREVNFEMAPAVKIKGRLVGTGSFPRLPPQDYRGKDEKLIAGQSVHRQAPLARWKVWLTGPQLAPATSVFASAESDQDGRFEFANVPPGYEWQIQADTHHRANDPRSPIFTPEPGSDVVLEVELDEKQTGLKFLPASVKPGAERSAPNP